MSSLIAVLAVGATTAAAVVLPQLPPSFPFAAEPTPGASPSQIHSPDPAPLPTPVQTPDIPPPPPPAPVSPLALGCDTTSVMSVWAHQDDDLIFANPSLQEAVSNGECVRTLYLTAGDAGKGTNYSRSRELGILRAYNTMRGAQAFWDETSITMLSGAHVTLFSRQGDPKLSVAFLRLPDGGLDAGGFTATGHSSIPQLESGAIPALAPIDGAPALSAAVLQQTVAEAITAWAPTRLFTHIPATSPLTQGDHPDHGATGAIVRAAAQSVGYPMDAIRYFVGYPSQNLPANLSGDLLNRKVDTYRIYAKEDPVIACADNTACLARKGFGAWLQRSYPKTDAELGIG
ncbi:PIG-L family deacetylase [Microbacterium sp. BG28]|uniref:PIG-L family deacetylase n=1 Tax=Microbacterium sp. BG28 TaxID=3097356 RepID=UPI002A59B024|nr:PIG-L family deacetylase [Microbacterium sp. BG28]MDY0829441.1 PIG-L family deacetylase [Microbacterium sp. BG28]